MDLGGGEVEAMDIGGEGMEGDGSRRSVMDLSGGQVVGDQF